jgi:hypothetical protein
MLTFYAIKPCCLSALLLAAATITSVHAANVCDVVYQVSTKSIQTPSHSYNVITVMANLLSARGFPSVAPNT